MALIRELKLLDPATGRVQFTPPTPRRTWGNYAWKSSPDGKWLGAWYRTENNASRPGDPDPFDRPMNAKVWELPR